MRQPLGSGHHQIYLHVQHELELLPIWHWRLQFDVTTRVSGSRHNVASLWHGNLTRADVLPIEELKLMRVY